MRIDLNNLEIFIDEWRETPYLPGQCVKGRGVDCLRYIDKGLQAATGQDLDPLPREAQDAALHNPEVVFRITRLLASRFDMKTVERTDPPYRAADILAVRTKTFGRKPLTREEKVTKSPHHVLIVGPTGLVCWHAMRTASPETSKVCWLGVGGVLACYDVLQVWRSK